MIRVLIVDDSAVILEGLSSLLEAQPDIKVVGTANDGHEGVDKAGQLLPDVVIMDAQMPNMDGVEATRHVKRDFPSIGVLFLSACADYIESGKAAGADGYLLKDCESEELLAKIRCVAARYRRSQDVV